MTTSSIPLADLGLGRPGCRLMPVLRHPKETLAAVRSLVARFGVLFRHADPAALVRRADGPGSRSALSHASQVTWDLAVLDRHLRTLLGEEHRSPACPAEPAADEVGQEKVLDDLTRTGDQLAHAIVAATDADWRRATTTRNRWVLDFIVLTFHDAGHELEDAERAVHAASADSGPWRQREARMVAARSPAAMAPLRMR